MCIVVNCAKIKNVTSLFQNLNWVKVNGPRGLKRDDSGYMEVEGHKFTKIGSP